MQNSRPVQRIRRACYRMSDRPKAQTGPRRLYRPGSGAAKSRRREHNSRHQADHQLCPIWVPDVRVSDKKFVARSTLHKAAELPDLPYVRTVAPGLCLLDPFDSRDYSPRTDTNSNRRQRTPPDRCSPTARLPRRALSSKRTAAAATPASTHTARRTACSS